jgi:hypothetical protein
MTAIGENVSINMRVFKRTVFCTLLLSFFAVVIFFCGCASTPKNLFTVSGPGWRIQQGQALWTPRKGAPQFGGDIVLATDANGRSFVQFEKMPLSLVTVQITPTDWVLNFSQLGGFWKGHQPAPARTIWLYLPDALAGKPLPKAFHFEQKPDGGWRIDDVKTGESLEGFLSS